MMKQKVLFFLTITGCGLLTACQSEMNHTSISIMLLVSTCITYLMYKTNKIRAKKQDTIIHHITFFEETPSILLGKEQEIDKLREERVSLQNELFEKTGLGKRIRLAGKELSKEDTSSKPFTTKEFLILIEAVDNIYKGFSTQLKESYPSLNESELKICYLLKAGAKTKNIAAIIPMTPNAVTKKKQKIKEKMNSTSKSGCF